MYVLDFFKNNNYLYTIRSHDHQTYGKLLKALEEFNTHLIRDHDKVGFRNQQFVLRIWEICAPMNSWYRVYVVPDGVDVEYVM